MKRLAYILHIDDAPTGHGAVMTPAEAERTNETLPPGYEWTNPTPIGVTPFDAVRLDGTRKTYPSHAAYDAAMRSGEMHAYRRRAIEYLKTENEAEKAA